MVQTCKNGKYINSVKGVDYCTCYSLRSTTLCRDCREQKQLKKSKQRFTLHTTDTIWDGTTFALLQDVGAVQEWIVATHYNPKNVTWGSGKYFSNKSEAMRHYAQSLRKPCKAYQYYFSRLHKKWAVIDTRTNVISHYEDSEYKAGSTASKFNVQVYKGERP